MDPVLIGGAVAFGLLVLLVGLLVRQSKLAGAAKAQLHDMEVAVERKKNASSELAAHAQSIAEWLHTPPDA